MGKYKDNPWLGLESYQENQIIYGRNKEIEELSQGVLNNNETVLYGKSGIGKSSIINAGILPIVRKHGYFPIVVRLDHSNKHSYIKQLSDLIEMGAHVSECTIAKPIEEQLLWEYFHTHRFNKTKEDKSKLVIIFDQFEEIFTLQKNAAIKNRFFRELGDVLNNVMPKGLTEEYLIETTNLQPSTTKLESVSGFADMADLFSSLAANVNNSVNKYIEDNEIHFVFTLREDFLSEFEHHTSKIPSLKQHRYGLRPLNKEQAAEVILKPRPELVDEGVARVIIEAVKNHTDISLGDEPEIDVDAAVLSLFLSQIYDKRATTESSISVDLVKTFGKDIIKDFYEGAIKGLSSQQIDYLEKELLTGENRRDSRSRADFKAGGFSENELKRLIDSKKILRQFHYEGDLRVEFIHDILCPIVKEHRLLREQEQKAKAIEKKYLRYKCISLRVSLFFLFIIFLVLFDYCMNLVTEPRSIKHPIKAEQLGTQNIFHSDNAENSELFIHGSYSGFWGDTNLKKIVFTDTFNSFGNFIVPKLDEVVFKKGTFRLSSNTFSNVPHIVTIMDSVEYISTWGNIISINAPIEYNIGKNENFKILHSDILLSKSNKDSISEWDIVFAGNQDKSSPIVIPYNIKLDDTQTNLNIRIAKKIEFDSINKEELNNEEYYYLVNTSPKDSITTASIEYNNYLANLTYANIANAIVIKKFRLYNVKEAIFPHAKELWSIECPNLRRLELPNIEKLAPKAISAINNYRVLTELVLPKKICVNRDTLQQNLFRWGLGKLVKHIIPHNDSTSLVRLYNTFWISSESEIQNDTLFQNCPYNKTKLRLSSHINDIANNAFEGAVNLEDLSVAISNDKYFCYGNAIYRHGKYEVEGYAPNATEIYLLAWKPNRLLRLGDKVKNIYTFFPETFNKNSIIGNSLDKVTLYVPKLKLQRAIATCGNIFKEIKPLNTYQILFIDILFTIKNLFGLFSIQLIMAFILLFGAILYRKTRYYSLLLCIVYPLCFICYHIGVKILESTKYNAFVPFCIALIFIISILMVKNIILHYKRK